MAITDRQFRDIHYQILNRHWHVAYLDKKTRDGKSLKFFDFLQGLARYMLFLFLSIPHAFFSFRTCDILFLSGAQNDYYSLKPVADNLNNSRHLTFHRRNFTHDKLPDFWFYFAGLFALPMIIRLYKNANEVEKRFILRRLDRMLWSGFAVEIYQYIFAKLTVRAIVVSNDHVVWCRAAILAARKSQIVSCYIPHASTGKYFPPLNMDIAFLDSQYQAERYQLAAVNADAGMSDIAKGRKTSETDIIITGAVRYESYLAEDSAASRSPAVSAPTAAGTSIGATAKATAETNPERATGLPASSRLAPSQSVTGRQQVDVLVCFTMIDNDMLVRQVLTKLSELPFRGNIVIRPHPGDTRRHADFRKLARQFGFDYSNPCRSIMDIGDIRAILTGGSGTLIDGLMCGAAIGSAELWYNAYDTGDYYGLKRHGVLELVADIEELGNLSFLSVAHDEMGEKPVPSGRAGYFNDHINHPNHLPSSIIIEKLQEILY